jgi:hypothetical protein
MGKNQTTAIMKKTITLAIGILSVHTAFAQIGNVGVGTATPDKKLHIKSNSATTLKIEGDDTGYSNAEIEMVANNANNYRGLGVIMTDKGGNNSWYVGKPYANNDRFMINRKANPTFYSEASALATGAGVITGTENFLTINNTGHMGIGTTSPTNKLHLAGGTNPLRLEGLSTAAANEKIITTDANGVWHEEDSVDMSAESALNTATQYTQTVGYPGVTNATQYDTDTVVLTKGVYMVTPYNVISGITYTTWYYGQFVSIANAGTIDSGFINFPLDIFTSPLGYYNRGPYYLKVKSDTATVFTRMWNPSGTGTFSVPAGQGFSVYYVKIN